MKDSRLAAIPIDHVVAELAAFPLAAVAGLELGVTRLDPQLERGDPRGNTGRLWRAAEAHLLGSFPAFAVDEAVAVRDHLWFTAGSESAVPIHSYLKRLASQFLEPLGPIARPRLKPGERRTLPAHDLAAPLARERWRWLALAMPPDLVLAALPGGAGQVDLLAPSLARRLRDAGFAELHLHLGAGMEFPVLWIACLHALATPEMSSTKLESPGAELDEGRLLCPLLLRAAVARYLLAAFLATRSGSQDFVQYVALSARPRVAQRFGWGAWNLLAESIDELRGGRVGVAGASNRWHAALQSVYRSLVGLRSASLFLRSGDSLERADPLAALALGPRDGRTAEVRFVTQALDYLEQSANGPHSGDSVFESLFWQVVRVRSLFYRHVVQRPMTPGLQWFIRHFSRLSAPKKRLSDAVLVQAAARTAGAAVGLRSLEVRTAPNEPPDKLRSFVQTVEAEAARLGERESNSPHSTGSPHSRAGWQPTVEVGIVYHFTKEREGGAKQGRPRGHGRSSHADPRHTGRSLYEGNPAGWRYATFVTKRRSEANHLKWLLRRFPLSLELFRGLDVCTDELGVPNWVLAPLLRDVRSVATRSARYVRQLYGLDVPALATTVHAGEDFVHLLTGLRHVDEAIELYDLRSGDRLGHGISLGVEAREWAQRTARVLLTREERMWDLLWEWSWYSRGCFCVDPGRPLVLERELAEHTAHIFSSRVEPHTLARLRSDLGDPRLLAWLGFPYGWPPHGVRPDIMTRMGRLLTYLTSRRVFDRGMELVWVDTQRDAEALHALQVELRRKVGSRGLTVEVNPTSNLLIGNLGDLTTHPLWRLRPPRVLDEVPPVAICVGSDDPVVFGSDLRREYQALWDALSLAGLSEDEIHGWIEHTRATGMSARFTLPNRSGRSLVRRWP